MRRIIKQHLPKTSLALLVAELFVLLASAYAGILLRFYESNQSLSLVLWRSFPEAATLAFAALFSMITLGAYHADYREDFRYSLLRLLAALVFGLCLLTLVYYLFPNNYLGRGVLAISVIISTVAILLIRYVAHWREGHANRVERVLVLGTGRMAKECLEWINNSAEGKKFKIVGFIPMPHEQPEVPENGILSLQGTLPDIVEKLDVAEVIVAVRNRRGGDFPVEELLECKLSGVKVCDSASFFERETKQIRIEYLQPSWLVFGGGFDQSFLRTNIKRDFDLLASSILMLITLPVMLITAFCIVLEGWLSRDRGPIFYQQERVGLDGESFMVLKFRSMRMDAEKFGVPQWATENDPRVTKVGKFIRKVRIDELPQIINVFKGEMSFVGPRPERPFFVKQFCDEIPYYNMRHSIKPGITGWAQVRYQYGASVDDACEKLQYDLYYVKHHSLFLDIIIMWDTVSVVLFGKGAR